MGAVHLGVTDGSRALAFYTDVVGLRLLQGNAGHLHLGVDGRELVVVHPGAGRPVLRGTSGLYHLALVVPSRRELARVIGRLSLLGYPQAPTDHVLTKSDYFWDPDGNGIEIYAETPEDGTWVFTGGGFIGRASDGTVRSGRDPIDLPELLAELNADDRLEAPLPAQTRMGHVHLHIADLEEATRFYHEVIGFDVTGVARSWGVSFVSAGGYHHHLGLNTWAGRGAPPAPSDAAGLRHFTIELPSGSDLEDLLARLEQAGRPATESHEGFFAADPTGNRIRLALRRESGPGDAGPVS